MALTRGLSDSAGAGDAAQPQRPTGLLGRLLAPGEGGRNPILAALGYYSSESRAIGAGNALYEQSLARAEAAAAVEGEVKGAFAPRFEMLAVHVYLTLRRLRAEKGSVYESEVKTVMQCLFDVFWTDVRTRMIMKENDMKLIASGKWIKDCEQRFFGMALAFDETWGDQGKFCAAIKRNVTCLNGDPTRIERFRAYMERERLRLDETPIEQIWMGAYWDERYP